MCHMLFTPFIFVRRRCSLVSLSLSLPLFSFPFSLALAFVTISVSLTAALIFSLLRPLSLFILSYFPSHRAVSLPHRAHVRSLPFSLLFLSLCWLTRRYFSALLLFSRSVSLLLSLFPARAFSESRSSLISVSLLLATSLILFSVLLAPLSSPSLPFRLLVYTLVTRALSPPFSISLLLPYVRDSSLSYLRARPCCFSFSMFHHCGGTLRFIVSVCSSSLSLLLSLSLSLFLSLTLALPTRPSCMHLSTHVERYFPPSSPSARPSPSFTRAEGLFPRRRAG